MACGQAPEVLFCGRRSGRDLDKFAAAGLTPLPAETVEAPAIAEALAHVECEVQAEHPAGDHIISVGRVRAVSAQPGTLAEDWRDLVTAPPLFHLDGNRFTTSSGAVVEPDMREV
jgi:flavin reductase (DIM6/NTAB) family NADH-FMN oxidoreductase RutF